MSAGHGIGGRLWRHSGAWIGLLLLAILLVPALSALLLPLPDPDLTNPAQRMLPFGAPGHLLGTDHLGRDLLARLVWGLRSSLAVGALATALAAFVGTALGLVAGFFGRWPDAVIMRLIDVLLAFPYLLLALAIVAALGPGLANAMLAIAVANIPFFARAVRGAVIGIAHEDFIDAARLAGLSAPRILLREVLPNVVPAVLVMTTTTLGWMILETAGLSFLGLGAQPPQADLGSMLGQGREFLTTYPQLAALPGLVILLTVVGINLFGDALRDAIEPRPGEKRAPRTPAAPAVEPAASDDRALLTVRDLTVAFPARGKPATVVDAVDFALAPGERVGVVGESGSGKTLTALALLRLVPPPGAIGGSVRLQGQEVLSLDRERLRALRGRTIAYVPQEPLTALDPLFTIGSQIGEAIGAHGHEPRAALRERVQALLKAARLPEPARIARRYPHQLSGGMRQRAAIAMALAHSPPLIIADEATTALDVTVQDEILALLERISTEQGHALLFISHDLGVVARLCRRVLVMYAGRLVEDGPLETILAGPAHPYTRALLAAAPELGRPDKPLAVVPGQPPGPGQLPPGCAFAPRCPHAIEACEVDEPALRTVGPHHRVRCIRIEELAP